MKFLVYHSKTVLKLLLLICGFSCVLLGVIGIFVPLLPTVPFLLLALACFDRSSPRFHAWLLHHPFIGEPIRSWQQNRTIPRKSKRLAIASVLISGAVSLYLIQMWQVKLFLVLLLGTLLIILIRLPVNEAETTK